MSALRYLSKKFGEVLDVLPKNTVTDFFWIYWQYWLVYHSVLNLVRPKKFTEKIQRLKLFDRKNADCLFADKYSVRSYIAEKIGEEKLIPLLGVYDSVEEIDFGVLPDSFVLKAAHASGRTIICSDKKTADFESIRHKMKGWLKENFYHVNREWVYRDVKPRIVCEKSMIDDSGKPPIDYKFFCFNGNPKYVQVDIGRFGNHTRDIYNMDWEMQPFTANAYPKSVSVNGSPRPDNFSEMAEIAERLSKGMKFIRVDLYSVEGRTYFGELTFFPGNGFLRFEPPEYDRVMGDLLRL